MVKIEKQQDPSNEDVVTEVTKSKSDKRKRSADNTLTGMSIIVSRRMTLGVRDEQSNPRDAYEQVQATDCVRGLK